jgi:hypothetical protein
MDRVRLSFLALLFASPAFAQVAGGSSSTTATTTANSSTLTSGTATSLAAGQLIASSTTAGSIVVPSFTLLYAGGAAIAPKGILTTNATSGWSGATVQVDWWSAAPTFTNGDGGTYAVATGAASYLGSLTCTFGGTIGSATLGQAADGAYAECTPNAGTVMMPKLSTTNTVFWTMLSLSTVTKASGATFTFKPAAALN